MLPQNVQRTEGMGLGLRKPALLWTFFSFPARGIFRAFATVMGHSCDMPFLIFLGVQFPIQKCPWQGLLPGPHWWKP